LAVSAEFLEFVKEQMASFAAVSHRRMFGGAGLFCDGLMFAPISSA
jgi:DNA transformation protein